eukprot:152090_1
MEKIQKVNDELKQQQQERLKLEEERQRLIAEQNRLQAQQQKQRQQQEQERQRLIQERNRLEQERIQQQQRIRHPTYSSKLCGWCQNNWKNFRGKHCVCKGVGKVKVLNPPTKCHWCKGKGDDKHQRMRGIARCTECGGSGW